MTAVRVVVLDHTAQTGGAELALLRTAAALDPAEVDLTVLLFADGPLVDRLRSIGVRVRVLPLDPRVAASDRHAAGRLGALRSAARTLPFVRRLARELRALDPDLVHTTSLKADLIGLLAGRMARRPVIWHVHDRIAVDYLPGPVVRVFQALARRAVSEVVVNSRATADTLLPLRRWTLVHPGLTPEQIGPDPIDRRSPAPPVVGIVGRISPTKGQREFLAAAALLADRFPDARFRIVGDALFTEREYAHQVRGQARALGDRVEFTGWVDDPAAELDRLSVMVHASPTPEPFGQVVAEAMARGVPVVATRGGGVDEIVRPAGEEPRGELVDPGDVAGMAAAVGRLLSDPDTAASRARQAWFGVRRDYPIERTAAQLTAVWRRHARDRAPGASGAPGPTNSAPRPVDAERAAR